MSTKWTEEEQMQLVDAINQASSSGINWADVARVVPGRTGKQCREKFKVCPCLTVVGHSVWVIGFA